MERVTPIYDGDNSPPKINARSLARGKRERPCDGCRRRKGRCVQVEGQSQCAACAVHNQPCTYVEDPKPRKRKTDPATLISPGSVKRRTQTFPPTPLALASGVQSAPKNVLPLKEPKSAPADKQVSTVPPTSLLTEHHIHIGPTTEHEPALLRMSNKVTDAGIGNIRDYREAMFLVKSLNTSSTQNRTSALQTMLKPHLTQVADTYRRKVHEQFPILDDATIALLQAGSMAACDTLVIAAMFLAVAPWYEGQDEKKQPLARNDRTTLEGLTFALFMQSLYQPNLNTMQAGLLLMQCGFVDTKALNNQLAEVCFELGLNLDCSSWALNPAEKSLRRRLAWAVYAQDRWCALIHGRPPAISRSNWAVVQLSEADFSQVCQLSESDEARLRRQNLFIQTVKLTRLLADIISTFYSVSAMREVEGKGASALRFLLERAKRVQVPLKEWFASLPASLRMDSADASNNSPAAINERGEEGENVIIANSTPTTATTTTTTTNNSPAFLHLAYYATEITLHRCIVRAQPSDPLADPSLVAIVRTAAKERLVSALEFANRLRAPALAGFWYFAARPCFALVGTFGALLAASAPACEEADFYAARLREFRWTLGVAARHAPLPLVAHAARNVDAHLVLLDGLPPKPSARDLADRREAAEATERAARRERGSDDDDDDNDDYDRNLMPARAGFNAGEPFVIDEEVLLDDEDEDEDDDGEEIYDDVEDDDEDDVEDEDGDIEEDGPEDFEAEEGG